MGLHQRNAHGRVFVGEKALQYLSNRKRDSHGDHIVMNIPAGFPPQAQKDVVVQTMVSHVFVTVPATFTGTPAGFATGTVNPQANTASPARTTQRNGNSESTPTDQPSADRSPSQQTESATRHRHAGTAVASQSFQSASYSGTITAAYDPSATYYTNTPESDSGNSSSTYGQSSSNQLNTMSEQELPVAVKAAIAVGAVVGFALLGILLYFCLRRRKSPSGGDSNEKHGSIFGAQQDIPQPYSPTQPNPRTSSVAPQLSLRPVTQFLPNLAENRKSGDLLNSMTGGAKSAWIRQPATENPFADSSAGEKARPITPNGNPFDDRQRVVPATVGTANANTQRNVETFNQRIPESNTSTITAPAAAVVAATAPSNSRAEADPGRNGSPSKQGPNNVHRVQLDFKPSMDDELELRSGQLVRMLHEYDDGWALCVRMDRSQQGVCPRTCLSKLPVKPRQGPPGNQRPYSPNAGPPADGRNPNAPAPTGQPGRPQMPAVANLRPDSSQMFNPNGMFPRPLTPTGNSDRGDSPDAGRKPVPGQAF